MRKLSKLLTTLCVVSTLFNVAACDFNFTDGKEPEMPTVSNYEVSFNEEMLQMIVGEQKQLSVNAYADEVLDASAQFVWWSSDEKVVTVANGVVTAVAGGTAYITVRYEDVTDTMKVTVAEEVTKENVNTFSEEYINIFGRSYIQDGALMFDHSVNAVEVGIIATSLKISLKTSYTSYMRVWIDGVEQDDWILIDSKTTADYVVAEGLEFGYHSIKMVKATEMQLATWAIASFDAETFATPVEKPELKIEFIGDSITAGYGVLGVQGEGRTVHNSDSTKSYAYQTAMLLNADCSVVAWSGICAKAFHWAKDINMDYLYELQSYANRNEYAFKFKPNVVVLNLGTNDADYINSVNPSYKASFATDYLDFLKFVRAKNPNAYIICLYGMMGASQTVDSGILSAVESLADSKIVYNPIQITANFEGAGGHPNLAAQTSWAELLAAYINTLNL